MTKATEIPNQVFIGCPWKSVRQKYDKAIHDLRKKFPLSFIIIGRDENQDAKELLEIIKTKLASSSYAIFDATGGNANVSLEYGYAEGVGIQRGIYLGTHQASSKASEDSPIIADLAGKNQVRYAQQSRLKALLSTFAKNHVYTKRFEKCLWKRYRKKLKGQKKRLRSLALKIIHCLDDQIEIRREDVVQKMQADISNYTRIEIENMLKILHAEDLIEVSTGRFSSIRVR